MDPRQVKGDMSVRVVGRRAVGGVLALVVVPVLTLIIGVSPVAAHDTSTNSVALVVGDRRVTATAPVPFAEVGFTDTSGDGLIDNMEVAQQESMLAESLVDVVRQHVRLRIDGERSMVIGAGVPSINKLGSTGAASAFVTLVFASGPHDGSVDQVELEWAFSSTPSEVVLSHRGGATASQFGDDGSVSFSLDAWSSARSFFALGIDHIRLGPDHLLFLLVLTLTVAGAVVTGETARRTVKLVTAFTLGHAISLCLAYFDVISVPAHIVEPLISLSIVAAAVLAIRGRSQDARPWIATLIGAVHGLGFAASLSSLGVATTARIPALAAFNVGIDVAQTAAVLAGLAVLWAWNRVSAERMSWITIPAASIAGVVGLAWTTTRILGG